MADVNQMITLGIGTPGDIEHFILFGLTAGTAEAPAVPAPLYTPRLQPPGSRLFHPATQRVHRPTRRV